MGDVDIYADPFKELVQLPPEVEAELAVKALRYAKAVRGYRRPALARVFEPLAYIVPSELDIENYWRRPSASFNPGAILIGDRVGVFPRLVFEYYWYVSSIGYFVLSVERLLERSYERPIRARIVMFPRYYWEMGKGAEDPRVASCGERLKILYTAVAYTARGVHPLQGYAELGKDFSEISRGYLRIKIGGEHYVPASWKDSALLDPCSPRGYMLIRPTLSLGDRYVEVSWRGYADLGDRSIDSEAMEPVLTPEEWELKTGWSTNALELSANEYLVGWHAVLRNGVYVNGLAMVSKEGELLGVSDYLLVPERSEELYGDRPGVIFGCGLIRYKEKLIWIGGVADTAIGIYAADLEKALESLRPFKKG